MNRNKQARQQHQYWSSHRKPQTILYIFFVCSFARSLVCAKAAAVESIFQTRKTKLTTHSCFNFNIYIYDPIKIVTLDLHLRASSRAFTSFAHFTCKLLWFTCDCVYVVRRECCKPYAYSEFLIYLKIYTQK